MLITNILLGIIVLCLILIIIRIDYMQSFLTRQSYYNDNSASGPVNAFIVNIAQYLYQIKEILKNSKNN